MLQARMRGIINQRFEVDSDGVRLTELAIGGQESSTFTLHGHPYLISRPRHRKEFTLSGPDGVFAGAVLSGRNWAVTGNNGRYDVVKPRLIGLEWQIYVGPRQVGAVRKQQAFSRTVELVAAPEVPPPAQIFMLYLVLVLLRRQQGAAAVGSQ